MIMEAKNKKDRKKARTAFLAWFSLTLLLFFSFGIFTRIIAQKGISMLEEKKARYDGIFRKQADYNFRMDEMYRNMHSLTIKERTGNEHRLLQQIITQERDKMLDEIDGKIVADSQSLCEKILKAKEVALILKKKNSFFKKEIAYSFIS